MSRPKRTRRVAFLPQVTRFKPVGVRSFRIKVVSLSVEEAESIRLKDLENLEQTQAAEKMNISQPTFQRVLVSAGQKVADAIINGKAIRIEGGIYEIVR